MYQQNLFDSTGAQLSLHPGVLAHFPRTRYQGSKRKLLSHLEPAFNTQPFGSILDLYSGSGTVTLLLRLMGKSVSANDYLRYNVMVARLFLSCVPEHLHAQPAKEEINWLLNEAPIKDKPLVATNFQGIFFTDEENLQIDRFCQNVTEFEPQARMLYRYALGQALMMKRPYNLFHRANLAMRQREVQRSFGNAKTWATPISTHMERLLAELRKFPFPSVRSTGRAYSVNTLDLSALPEFDAIYLDPPYLASNRVGIDYCDFYHFLEGLCDYRLFSKGNTGYPHRPIRNKPSAWNNVAGAIGEFNRVAEKWPDAIFFISYRSDGFPSREEICQTLARFARSTYCLVEKNYKYVLSINGDSAEQILVSLPSATLMKSEGAVHA